MNAITVPTIFTAKDQLLPFFAKASAGLGSFSQKAEASLARQERAFRKLTPTISEAGHKFLDFAKEAIGAMAIFEGVKFSFEALEKYDSAIASLRTKLSGLSDTDFSKFQHKVNDVAKATGESSIDMAGAFEKIISLNRELAKSPDGLGEVATGAHLLSKIAKSDLPTAADGLVGVMNQFNLKAEESDRTVNVLAASQAKHASSINDTMAGLTSLGPLASHYNVSLEQSVGLLDVLAEKQIKGTEAGAAARMTIIKLQAAHAGYQSGVFNLSDALEQVKHKLDSFRTAKEKDNFVAALFGKRQQATGILLLENADKMREYTQSLTGTTDAERLAGIQENTLSGFIERLKNQWVNLITRQDQASWSLNVLKGIIGFVTNHLAQLVLAGAGILAFFAAWKLYLIGANIALKLFNVSLLGTTAAAVEADTAIAASTVTVGGFGAAISGVATEIGVAETAAAGFFAMLGEFVIPAALVALAGYSFWKGIVDAPKTDPDYKPTYFNSKKPSTLHSPFQNTQEESAYQDWWLQNRKSGKNDADVQRDSFAKIWESDPTHAPLSIPGKADPAPVLNPVYSGHNINPANGAINHSLDINLNDPHNMVKDTTVKGAFHIPVKVNSTQGQK